MNRTPNEIVELYNQLINSTPPNILDGVCTGAVQGQTVTVVCKGQTIRAIALSSCPPGKCVAFRDDNSGQWYFAGANQSNIITENSVRSYRHHPEINPSVSYRGGLLASSNNYIQGTQEAPIMANLIVQMVGDTSGWGTPVKQTLRKVACLIGPTYTPLQPIRDALLAWNYVCENISLGQLTTAKLANYDVLIVRVVNTTGPTEPYGNDPFILGDQVSAIASMLKAKKLVILGGCGCPYGSIPLDDLLRRLGYSWSVPQTRTLEESKKPVVVYPWVIQADARAGVKTTQNLDPYITDRTVFSNVKPEEVLVKSTNGQIMMAYSPYPDCLKNLQNISP